MHILSLVTTIIISLTRYSIALPPLLLPSPNTSSSLDPLILNNATTILSKGPWPRVPWTHVLDGSAIVAIDHYGRHVCSGDFKCEQRVTDGIAQISRIVNREYMMGHEKIDSFMSQSGVASFWIKQETMVPKDVVEDLVANLRRFALDYGTTEVTHAGIVNYGTLAATFELTFPGIKD